MTIRLGQKISWALADKVTFLIYGLVFRILQIRSLPPAEFGLYALFEAAFIFLFIIADNIALAPLIKFGSDLQERPRVNLLSLIVYTSFTLGAALLLFFLQSPLAIILNEPRFTVVATFFPPYIALSIPRMYLLSVQQRDLRMQTIFTANFIWMGTMGLVTTLLLAFHHLRRFEDMMLIIYAGSAISSLHLLWISRKKIRFSRKGKLKLREFLRFSTFLAGSGIFSNLLLRLDTYIVQLFFSTATTGIYQSAKTLFRLFESPNHAVGSVLFPAVSRLVHERKQQQLRQLLQQSISSYFWALIGIGILAIIGAPVVIDFLLPHKYALAIPIFQRLTLAAAFLPLSLQIFILIATGNTQRLFRYTIAAVLAGVTAFILAGSFQCATCIPLGILTYHAVLAVQVTRFVQRTFQLPRWYFANPRHTIFFKKLQRA